MFDFDAFEKELDEQNLALESMIAEMDIAQEGLFKPKSLDQMLSKVQKQVNKKCKSVDACDDLLAKLKGEEAKFNSSLKTMKNAALQFKADGDKKALKAAIGPASKELKKTCNIINLNDVVDDKQDVTDADIKKLHDFLVGTRKIINEKKKALKSSGAMEGMTDMDYTDFDLYMDAAMESRGKRNRAKANAQAQQQAAQNNATKTPEQEKEEKKKKKFGELGAIQGAQRHLAQTCYKMADRCKRMAKGKDSGFWVAAAKWFNSMYEKLQKRLTPEQLETCKQKCDEWQKKVDEKRAKKSGNSDSEAAAEAMTLSAMEQALGDIHDGLSQCSTIAVEMELSMSDDFESAMESFDMDDDFDFALEAEGEDKKKKEKKDKKKFGELGAIQGLQRRLAVHCYKMAAKCKKWAGTEKFAAQKGIFFNLYKFYTKLNKKLSDKLTVDQITKYRDAITAYDKKVVEAKNKAAKKAANEAFFGDADFSTAEVFAAVEQSMITVDDALAQWSDIAVEMELSDMEDMFDDDLALGMESDFDFDLDDDDDSDFGMESYSDPYLAFAEVAMEGLGQDIKDNWKLKHGEVRKECKENLKKARAAKKAGNMKEAIKYANAAKKGFMGLKAVANKLPATSMKGATKTNALKWADNQIAACDKFIAKCKGTPAKESFFDFDDDDFAMESAEEILGVYDDFDEDVIL